RPGAAGSLAEGGGHGGLEVLEEHIVLACRLVQQAAQGVVTAGAGAERLPGAGVAVSLESLADQIAEGPGRHPLGDRGASRCEWRQERYGMGNCLAGLHALDPLHVRSLPMIKLR